jgi:hypothetical protein
MNRDTKEKITNIAALVLFAAALWAALAVPEWVHSRNCDGCDWFWCEHYDGGGDI